MSYSSAYIRCSLNASKTPLHQHNQRQTERNCGAEAMSSWPTGVDPVSKQRRAGSPGKKWDQNRLFDDKYVEDADDDGDDEGEGDPMGKKRLALPLCLLGPLPRITELKSDQSPFVAIDEMFSYHIPTGLVVRPFKKQLVIPNHKAFPKTFNEIKRRSLNIDIYTSLAKNYRQQNFVMVENDGLDDVVDLKKVYVCGACGKFASDVSGAFNDHMKTEKIKHCSAVYAGGDVLRKYGFKVVSSKDVSLFVLVDGVKTPGLKVESPEYHGSGSSEVDRVGGIGNVSTKCSSVDEGADHSSETPMLQLYQGRTEPHNGRPSPNTLPRASNGAPSDWLSIRTAGKASQFGDCSPIFGPQCLRRQGLLDFDLIEDNLEPYGLSFQDQYTEHHTELPAQGRTQLPGGIVACHASSNQPRGSHPFLPLSGADHHYGQTGSSRLHNIPEKLQVDTAIGHNFESASMPLRDGPPPADRHHPEWTIPDLDLGPLASSYKDADKPTDKFNDE